MRGVLNAPGGSRGIVVFANAFYMYVENCRATFPPYIFWQGKQRIFNAINATVIHAGGFLRSFFSNWGVSLFCASGDLNYVNLLNVAELSLSFLPFRLGEKALYILSFRGE